MFWNNWRSDCSFFGGLAGWRGDVRGLNLPRPVSSDVAQLVLRRSAHVFASLARSCSVFRRQEGRLQVPANIQMVPAQQEQMLEPNPRLLFPSVPITRAGLPPPQPPATSWNFSWNSRAGAPAAQARRAAPGYFQPSTTAEKLDCTWSLVSVINV